MRRAVKNNKRNQTQDTRFWRIHEAFGEVVQDGIHFINASNLDFHYQYKNCPVVCDL